MSLRYASIIFAAILLFAGCSSGKKSSGSSSSDSEKTEDSATKKDSIADSLPNNIPFKVEQFQDKKGEDELEIQYPVAGNPELLQSIRMWISQNLTGSYTGDLGNAEAFFRHYDTQLGTDPDFEEYGGFSQDKFTLKFVDNYVVTYDHTFYVYEGGAHGMGGTYGTSFRQTDGKIFTKECFTTYTPLHNLFVEGLKKYFKASTNEELLSDLLIGDNLKKLSPPGLDPWITDEGIVFAYTPYEIAPYSAGSPTFVLKYEEVEPFLTPEGKSFFKPLEKKVP